MSKRIPQVSRDGAKGRRAKGGIVRKGLYNFHAWLGLLAGAVMLLIGFTGAVSVFKAELDWVMTPAMRVTPGERRVPFDQVVESVSMAYPDHVVKDVAVQKGARWAHIVRVAKPADGAGELRGEMGSRRAGGRDDAQVFVNPYTGRVQGERRGDSAAELVKKFHTNMWLNLRGGEIGKVGRLIVCTFGLMLVVLSLTGFWIYRNKLRSLFKIRFTCGRRILISDLHRVLGVWTIAFNLMIGVTATTWGVKEAEQFFGGEGDRRKHAVGEKGERPAGDRSHSKAKSEGQGVNAADYEAMIAAAAAAMPGMHIERVDVGGGSEVKVRGKASGSVIPQQGVQVEMAAGTGEIVMIRDDRSDPVGQRLYKFMKPLHYGKLAEGGSSWMEYAVKSLWVMLGMSPGLLSITGFVMYFMRRKASAGRKATAPAEVSQAVAGLSADGV